MTIEGARKANSKDLTGMRFGSLVVLHRVEGAYKYNGVLWHCLCDCGQTYDVAATLLINKRRTHCGNRDAHADQRSYSYADILGKRFGRLTVIEPTKNRSANGSVIWKCRCDCGNVIELSYNQIKWCSYKSCGCQKQENNYKLKEFQARADGTSIDIIKSKKLPRNNTSGYRGVGYSRGRYFAKIVFQKKQYHLGSFERIEEAAEARKEAEKVLFDGTAAYYERWELKAKIDPEWAENNPIKIFVMKDTRGLAISFDPKL